MYVLTIPTLITISFSIIVSIIYHLLVKKNFEILGSAHNIIELKNKENQGCNEIFISPIFKTNKSNFFLETIKFNLIANESKKNIIALGGINYSNFSKLNLTNSK